VYSYKNLSDQSEKDFAIHLTKEYGVATIPVAAFYQENVNHQVLRFCFCKKEETLDAAIERLLKV
jgi:methionine transaminase